MIMQGLTSSKRTGKLYLNIKLGEFFLKSDNTEHEAYAVKSTFFKEEEYPQKGLWFSELTDTITKVSVHDGNYGSQIIIDTSLGYSLQVPFDNKFGVQLMEKLPNLDLSKEVTLKPYDFTDDKDKRIQGISITQDEVKITSAYYDAETKKQADGFPEAPKARNGGKVSSAQWKAYFAQRNAHLLDLLYDWIEKQSFKDAEPQTTAQATANATNHIDDVQGDDGKVDDLPF